MNQRRKSCEGVPFELSTWCQTHGLANQASESLCAQYCAADDFEGLAKGQPIEPRDH